MNKENDPQQISEFWRRVFYTRRGRRAAIGTFLSLLGLGKIAYDRITGTIHDEEMRNVFTANHFQRIDTISDQVAIPPWGNNASLSSDFARITQNVTGEFPILDGSPPTQDTTLQGGWTIVYIPFPKDRITYKAALPPDVNNWEVFARTINGPAVVGMDTFRDQRILTITPALSGQWHYGNKLRNVPPSFDNTPLPIGQIYNLRANIVLVQKPPQL